MKLLPMFALVFVALVAGCGKQPAANVPPAPPSVEAAQPVNQPAPVQVAAKTTAETPTFDALTVWRAYNQNPTEARNMDGDTFRVTGWLFWNGKTPTGGGFGVFKHMNVSLVRVSVNAETLAEFQQAFGYEVNETRPAAREKAVTIEGKCLGMTSDGTVNMEGCRLVK